jgi:hypothetical protein
MYSNNESQYIERKKYQVGSCKVNVCAPMSVVGFTGPQGFTGPTGTKGEQGLQGVTGPQGFTGPTGTKGEQGLQGVTGYTGYTGPQGDSYWVQDPSLNIYYLQGNVGVNRSSPQYPLDVSGQVNTNSYYNLTNPNENTFVGYHPINVGLTGSGSCNTGVGFMALRDISANTSPVVFNNLYDISGNWKSVAMSSDGQYQTVVGAYDHYTSQLGYVYNSSDYGVTWVVDPSFAISDTSDNYVQISMSGDGKSAILISNTAANKGSGNIYVKSLATDYQWFNPGFFGPKNWALCSVSKDASLFVGVFIDGSNYYQYYISQDGGINWRNVFQSNNISCIYVGNSVGGLNRGIYIQNTVNNAYIFYTTDISGGFVTGATIQDDIFGLAVCTPDRTHEDLVILASSRYLYIYSVENNTVSSPFFDLSVIGGSYNIQSNSGISISSDGTKIYLLISVSFGIYTILVLNTRPSFPLFEDKYDINIQSGYPVGEPGCWQTLALSSSSQYLTLGVIYSRSSGVDGYITTSSTANNIQNNSFNTSIGYNSGQLLRSGIGNTFLGASSYSTNPNIYSSTAIGYASYVTDSNQVVIGGTQEKTYVPGKMTVGYSQSSSSLLPTNNSTFSIYGTADIQDVFQNSLLSNTLYNVSGTQNTSLGYQSLYSLTTGQYNTSLGAYSLYTLTTGNNNTSVGYSTLAYTNGNSNVALGYYAGGNYFGNKGTDGVQNTFLGYQTDIYSELTETSINNSTAIGANATIYQSHQVVLGTSAETINIPCGILNFLDYTNPNMSSPNYNIILNDVTGYIPDINFGIDNTTLGSQSLISIAGGQANTSVGAYALNHLTTGNNNTGIGAYALNLLTTDSYNTGIGAYALNNTNGSSNVAVGINSGSTLGNLNYNYDGNNNTFIGCMADVIKTTIESSINNSTAIGANATIYQSNQIMLGTETETVFCSGPSGVQIGVTNINGVTGYVHYSDGSRQTTWNVFTNPSSSPYDPSYGLISFGNIYMQFGSVSGLASSSPYITTIAFDFPFPNYCLNVQVTSYDSGSSGITNGTAVVSGISNTGFTVTLTSSPVVDGFMWTAYGN